MHSLWLIYIYILYIHTNIYIFAHTEQICVCVCVARERESKRETVKLHYLHFTQYILSITHLHKHTVLYFCLCHVFSPRMHCLHYVLDHCVGSGYLYHY